MALTLINPATAVIAVLNGTTVGGVALVTGTNLFAKQVTPLPYQSLVVALNTGGYAPEPYITPTSKAYMKSRVQLLIYGDPGSNGFDAGEALAFGLVGAVQQSLTVAGAVRCVFEESAPTYVGADPESSRHVWSLNLQVEYKTT
jgi:hypothetical protein